MTREIIKYDPRLFLFQVMEHGFNEKLIDDSFIEKFTKECAQMSFAFSKRYYSVVYEAYLKQASHCVLGIMNFGLIESSGKNLDDAIVILMGKGYVGLFREGWTRILKLVKHAGKTERYNYKTKFEREKYLAELLSAEPGRQWIGYDEYMIFMVMYYNKNKGKNGRN